MNRSEYVAGIRQALPVEELCAQLAEEAAELAQAALKLRRSLSNRNHTPIPPEKALERLTEETADVLLCMETMCLYTKEDEVTAIMDRKARRWLSRLEGGMQDENT